MKKIGGILLIYVFAITIAFSQQTYQSIKDFELIPFYTEEFNNNTNRWFMSDLYPFYSFIENGKINLSTLDFPNQLTKLIRLNVKKDFQIEYSIKHVKGDSSLPAYFIFNCQTYKSDGFGFTTLEKKIYLSNIKDKKAEVDKATTIEKFYPEFFNKYTIRKIKNKLYFFVNEELVYTESNLSFENSTIGWLIPANVSYAIDFFNVVYLKPVKKPKS